MVNVYKLQQIQLSFPLLHFFVIAVMLAPLKFIPSLHAWVGSLVWMLHWESNIKVVLCICAFLFLPWRKDNLPFFFFCISSGVSSTSNSVTGIDAMCPSSKEDFTEFEKLLKEKITQFEKSVHYSSFLDSLFRELCISCKPRVLYNLLKWSTSVYT